MTSTSPSAAVLVPVKSFDLAKNRLAEALDAATREALARSMAATVLAAAAPLDVFVLCDADDVAAWATAEGAEVIWCPDTDLDGAVRQGVAGLAERAVPRAVVAHSDLPLARDLAWVADWAGVTLVPDRRGDGTNVIGVPTGAGFEFAYGVGSFRRHLANAQRLGVGLRVVRDATLGWDVDDPDDLELPDGRSLDELLRAGTAS